MSGMIGLALSGGGSRAIAFHLGCLRALSDRGVLAQLRILSGVSGGAVIAGLYAYSDEHFDVFDERVVALLRRGLNGSVVRHLFAPMLLGKIVATNLVSRPTAIVAGAVGCPAPLRRWASRTDAFEAALRDLFGERVLTSPRRGGIDVVFTSCELRSGTAFRFGSTHSGSWRTKAIVDNRIPISHAIAASAAYPSFLPALDRIYQFDSPSGPKNRRVVLTDGGVYDNLGISCMEPGRRADISLNVFHPEYIIACYAGHGQFDDAPLPYGFTSRLGRALDTTFRRAQDATMSRLHRYAQSGTLKGFILPYLGQQDSRLPGPPADLVRREEVSNYPTNFSAMKERDIKRLSLRGEQITRLLLAHYCSEL